MVPGPPQWPAVTVPRVLLAWMTTEKPALQFFVVEVIRAPPQWPPVGVSLRRFIRCGLPATIETPSMPRRPAMLAAEVVALSYATTMSSLAGSMSAVKYVFEAAADQLRAPILFHAAAMDRAERQLRSTVSILRPGCGMLRETAA